MSMSKKDFIALADTIKQHRQAFLNNVDESITFGDQLVETLANFCASQNPRFNRDRWLGYIAGTNGPNGGKVKT